MNKALALEVARELKLSPEKVTLVCRSFHEGLKVLLRKPHEAKAGIYIENFLTLKLKERLIMHSLQKENAYDVEIKEQILENLKQLNRYKRNETKSKKGQAEG